MKLDNEWVRKYNIYLLEFWRIALSAVKPSPRVLTLFPPFPAFAEDPNFPGLLNSCQYFPALGETCKASQQTTGNICTPECTSLVNVCLKPNIFFYTVALLEKLHLCCIIFFFSNVLNVSPAYRVTPQSVKMRSDCLG